MELRRRLREALAFDAPYVVQRLVDDGVADTPELAERLFREAKRYLVLSEASPEFSYGMHSAMVDAAWHTFILFTAEYTDYGSLYFGGYLHHAPASATGGHRPALSSAQKVASFKDFRREYEALFGEPLPEVWYDDSSIAPARRVLNEHAGRLSVTAAAGIVDLRDPTGAAVLSVSALASEALAFIARERDFFVREIPGGLTDEEKIGIVRPLVRSGILRVAA